MKIFEAVKDQKVGSWLHAFGRIAAKEEELLSAETTRRLFDLDDKEALMQMVGLRGGNLMEALDESRNEDLALLYQLSPDKNFMELLLLPHEVHNLKAAVKRALLMGERPRAGELKNYLLGPALYSEEALIQGLVTSALTLSENDLNLSTRSGENLPGLKPWMQDLVAKAEASYREHYDLAAVDTLFEQEKWALLLARAKELKSRFIVRYVQKQIDLRNLDLTLRARHLKRDPKVLTESFVPGGTVPLEVYRSFYDLRHDRLKHDLRDAGFETFDQVLPPQNESFSKLEDEALLALLKEASTMSAGPERLLSWYLRREFERRNIQLAFTGIECGQSHEERRRLMRTVI